MKISWTLLVFGAMLVCGACSADSTDEADEIPVPAGAIKIRVVEEPILKGNIQEKTSVDDVALPQILKEKQQKLPRASANQKSLEELTAEEHALKKTIEEFSAAVDKVFPQINQTKLQVLTVLTKNQEFSKFFKVEEPSQKLTKDSAPENKLGQPEAFELVLQNVSSSEGNLKSNQGMAVKESSIKKIIEELLTEAEADLPLHDLEIKQQDATEPIETVEIKKQTDAQTNPDKEQSSDDMNVKDSSTQKADKEPASKDEVNLLQVFKEVQDIPSSAKSQHSNEDSIVEEPTVKKIIEQHATATEPTLQPVQEMTKPKPSEHTFMIMPQANNMREAEMVSDVKQEHFNADIKIENPSLKKTHKDSASDDVVDQPQVLEEVQKDEPHQAEHQHSNEGMTLEKPLAKEITKEIATDSETAVLQALEVKQAAGSEAVETVVDKEQTDVLVNPDKEHFPENIKVGDSSFTKKPVQEHIPEDKVDPPQVFEAVQQDIIGSTKNQQSNEGTTVDETVLKTKTEELAPENVALPPVLEMIMQKPHKLAYAFIITQQADKILEPQMRLPRQVQSFTGQDVQLYSNFEEAHGHPIVLADKRLIRHRQDVRLSYSNKRLSAKHRSVDYAKRRRMQSEEPNHWNTYRPRNIKKEQVIRNGPWVGNGQRQRNGQWVRRKSTNNRRIIGRSKLRNDKVFVLF